MSPEDRIGETVRVMQVAGVEQTEIAAVLISWAARYALAIGWSVEVVAGAQKAALDLHVQDRKGSSRS
jgi:hypothetical protein